MQTGGMLVVTAGGEKVLLSFMQSSPGDHVSNENILEVLGIEAVKSAQDSAGNDAVGASAATSTGEEAGTSAADSGQSDKDKDKGGSA